MTVSPLRALVMLFACILAGCTRYEPLSLHGAGSMRVEVELYKGPLSVSKIGQVGELAAVFGQTVYALDEWKAEASAFLGQPQCIEVLVGQAPTAGASAPDDKGGRWAACPDITGADLDAAYPRRMYIVQARCVTTGKAAQDRLSLRQWRDCMELRGTVEGADRMIDAACLLIQSGPFKNIGRGMYLPLTRCKKRVDRMLADNQTDPERTREKKELDAEYTICTTAFEAQLATITDSIARAAFVRERQMRNLACFHERIVAAVDSFASNLRLTAYRSADANVRYVATDRQIRGLLVGYSYIAAEFSNQIASRIAVLEKELGEGKDAKLMPTGDYLRDARPTDFVNLFDWLDAARVDYPIGSPGRLGTPERIRMARRLTADYYWEKVNEVYASGQGNVSMAFVKDALGNWDLKSFSNDPSELLASYRKVADAALKGAASLASGGGSKAAQKLTTAGRALALANRVAGGAAPTDDSDIAALHTRIAARLASRADRLKAEYTQLAGLQTTQNDALAARERELETAKATARTASETLAATPNQINATASANAQAALISSQAQRDTAAGEAAETTRRLNALPSEAITTLREVLDDGRAEIGERQAAIAGASTSSAP